MATVEQMGFQVPSIQERDDLILAGVEPAVRTAGSIGSAAARAAEVAATVLGVDKQQAEDTFTGQLEAMGMTEVAEDLVPVVHVTVGAEDDKGGVWTPSHVIRGHDKLTTTGGEAVPETYVCPQKMYVQRPADWWNKTRPNGVGESELVEAPLQIVLADLALRGTNKNWDKQQAELAKLIQKGYTSTVTVEGMPILAWPMMDADAIIGGIQRPDTKTVNRFVQHEMDRTDANDSCGPGAGVDGRQAYLTGSGGIAYSAFGFRAVMGQSQTA